MSSKDAIDFPSLISSQNWSLKRRELSKWFAERAPLCHSAYLGALALLYMPQRPPGRVNFICHAVRDIYTGLPGELGAPSVSLRNEIFGDLLNNLASSWKTSAAVFEFPSTTSVDGEDIQIPAPVYADLHALVTRHSKLEKQPDIGERLAVSLQRAIKNDPNAGVQDWVSQALKRQYNFFVQRAHFNCGKDDGGLMENFENFEETFHAMISPYFRGKEELDDILKRTNL